MTRFADLVSTARACLVADDGDLWGISLADVSWMGIEDDRILLTADPCRPGYAPDGQGLWSGPRPPDFALGSTSLEWAGRRWAASEFSFHDTDKAAVRELLHEAWHVVVQPQLFSDITSIETTGVPGADLLDTANGRTWLRLESVALSRALALVGTDDEWRSAAADALLFRRRRGLHATAAEAMREQNLDIAEGMAEYTGWRLSGASPQALAEHVQDLPDGDEVSWVRSFPYHTGPAYGYLLDATGSEWRRRLQVVKDLQALLSETVENHDLAAAETRGEAYGLEGVRRLETAREKRQQAKVDVLRKRFAASRVLRIRWQRNGLTFRPGQVTPLDIGTVYRHLAWRSPDGCELVAPGGALLTPDWSEIWVPLDASTLPDGSPPSLPTTLNGDGWTLRVTDVWRLRPDGDAWHVEPMP
ncbi:hypothetical protein ABN028_17095 [Actinopolymorpha sp. B17G11]|uniref:hypothetical protein n=1 Tax=Actinopolymorpha sp. B17G11 TaxID=3160861 RepID=UPI0032E4497A